MATATRRQVVEDIRATLAPQLRPSGYRKLKGFKPGGGLDSETVMLCAYKDRRPRSVGGFVVEEVVAFTADGIIEDAYGGGAVATEWGAMPLEDLRLVLEEVRRAVKGDLLN